VWLATKQNFYFTFKKQYIKVSKKAIHYKPYLHTTILQIKIMMFLGNTGEKIMPHPLNLKLGASPGATIRN
jgi:hypothetical protein